jgi:hypothetical protein
MDAEAVFGLLTIRRPDAVGSRDDKSLLNFAAAHTSPKPLLHSRGPALSPALGGIHDLISRALDY